MNTIVNINLDTLSLYSEVSVLQDTTQCDSQSISIFQESHSGRFRSLTKKQLLSHHNQSVYFVFRG